MLHSLEPHPPLIMAVWDMLKLPWPCLCFACKQSAPMFALIDWVDAGGECFSQPFCHACAVAEFGEIMQSPRNLPWLRRVKACKP